MYSANANALNAILCAVSPNILENIISCETAKEAWEMLEKTYEKPRKEEALEVVYCLGPFKHLNLNKNKLMKKM